MNPDFWMPHAHCVMNDWRLIFSSIIGNVLTAVSYFGIPFLLLTGTLRLWQIFTVKERRLFIHASVFIGLCGCTHLMEAWNWYHSNYLVESSLVFLTGIVSVTFYFRLRRFIIHRFHP